MSRRCSANPTGEAIPATVRHCAVRLVSAPWHCATHSRTTGAPHPRRTTVEPSKGGRTPVPRSPRTTSWCRTSEACLIHHHRPCAAIPAATMPSPTLWEYGATRHCHAYYCAPYGLPSTAPSSQRMDDDQTGSSHIATLEAAPERTQGAPWRSARSMILQDSCLLCHIVRHTATRN
jgi:hypothetical protein